MTTHDENIPGDGENVSEEQGSEHGEKPQTPKEAKTTVSSAGALVRAEKSIDACDIQILGTTDLEGESSVSLSTESETLSDTSLVLSFDPDTARELAQELEAQATHAEQWAIYKREASEPDA